MRALLLAALLVPLSLAARPGTSGDSRPSLRLPLDPLWAARVDDLLDRGNLDGLRRDGARAVPVLIERLLHPTRGAAAARALERILEARGVTDEEGAPMRLRPHSALQHDLMARWYLENRGAMERGW